MGYSSQIENMLREDAKRKRYPISVKFELLPICNLRCKMCYIETSAADVEKRGGLKTVDEWIQIAEQLLEVGTLFLLLTGGEVFLYPGFRELYEKLYDMGFSITINTNATMIDNEIVEWLAERPPKCVSISLYGSNNQTYEAVCGRKGMFTRVDHNIQALQKKNIRIELKTVVTPLNKDDKRNCREYARSKEIFYESTYYSYPAVRKEEIGNQIRMKPLEAVACGMSDDIFYHTHEELVEVYTKKLNQWKSTSTENGEVYGFSCSAANSSCWINWEGKMLACAMIPEPSTEPFKDGFLPAWEQLKAKCDVLHMSSKCAHCDMRNVCDVCPASNYAEGGSFETSSPYHCIETKERLRCMAEYLAKGES